MFLDIGDLAYIQIPFYQNLKALIYQYNEEVAKVRQFEELKINYRWDYNIDLKFPCRVAIIADQSYGKFPND